MAGSPGEVAARKLINDYSFYLDTAQFQAFANLFAADGVWGFEGREFHGRDDIYAVTDNVILYDGSPRTRHVASNVQVRAVGNDVTAQSYYTVFQQTDVLPLQAIFSGHYFDRFTTEDGRWCFQERIIRGGLTGDLSHHMRT